MAKRSFTLIETLAVLVLFSIIGAGLAGSLSAGVRIWSRARDAGIASSEVVLIADRVARDLRQSIYVEPAGFTGKEQEMVFVAFSGDSAYKISYKFDPMQKTLIRREEGLNSVFSEDLDKKSTEKQIGVLDDFRLAYLYLDKEKEEYAWKDSWPQDEKKVPAVKITVKLQEQVYEKTVFIPTA